MQITYGPRGISVSLTDEAPSRLVPDPSAHQVKPRRYYVYAHLDDKGVPFYIGKGTGDRAWGTGRHLTWQRHVTNNLHGIFAVRILKDNLSQSDALTLEEAWLAQEVATLVNVQNLAAPMDFAANERFRALTTANDRVIAAARLAEKTDLERAISLYQEALANVSTYAPFTSDATVVGAAYASWRQEHGISGEIRILDRLTMLFIKAGRAADAQSTMTSYFSLYPGDTAPVTAEKIRQRVAKAMVRTRQPKATIKLPEIGM
jgi:hypothetical protein